MHIKIAYRCALERRSNRQRFQGIAQSMFEASEIVLVRDVMSTAFDRRVGVFGGEPPIGLPRLRFTTPSPYAPVPMREHAH